MKPKADRLWYPALSSRESALNQRSNDSTNRGSHHRHHAGPPARNAVNTLRAEENAIRLRKSNIRRFGAGWLKPPGISKTLQGLIDEKAEREEQELAAMRYILNSTGILHP
jgi:hypothetical protein